MTAKMGRGKANGDRGADTKRKAKPEGAGEKRTRQKWTPIIGQNLPGMPRRKVHSAEARVLV